MATKLFPTAKKIVAAIAATVSHQEQQIVEDALDICCSIEKPRRLGIGDMIATRIPSEPKGTGVFIVFGDDFALRLTERKSGEVTFCLGTTCVSVNTTRPTSLTTRHIERLVDEIERHSMEQRRWRVAAFSGLIESAPWTGFALSAALEDRIARLIPAAGLPADGHQDSGSVAA